MTDPSSHPPTAGTPQRRRSPAQLTPAEVAHIVSRSTSPDDAKLRLGLGPVTDQAFLGYLESKGFGQGNPENTLKQRIDDAAGVRRDPWNPSKGMEIRPGRPDHERLVDGYVWQATPEGFVKERVQGTRADIERMQDAANLDGARQMAAGLLQGLAGMRKGSVSRLPPTAERPRTESIERAYKPPAPEPPQRTVKDGNVGPKVEGPKPTVTEGRTPTRSEAKVEPKSEARTVPRTESKAEATSGPKSEGRTEPRSEANAGPRSEGKPAPTAEVKSGGSDGEPATARGGERSVRLPRSGTKSLDQHLQRAFAGPMEGSAGQPSEVQRTVDSIVATIGERAADAALKDSTFQALDKVSNLTEAGTRFHTLAKLEANKMVTNGEVPKGYRLSAELRVQGKDGHSRLDVLVEAPDGSLHARDWKTTVKSGLDSKAARPQTGEMARHQEHVKDERGQPLASQESRSWVPLVQQAKNREAKQTVDGIANTIVERATGAAAKDDTFKGHLEAGNVAEADKTFNTIAKQETDKMVKNGEIPQGHEVAAEVTTKGKDGQNKLAIRVKMPEGYPERDWSATVKGGPSSGEIVRGEQNAAERATGARTTGREYSVSSAPTARQAPGRDGEKPAASGPKVDRAYSAAKPKAEKVATAKPTGDNLDKPKPEKAEKPKAENRKADKPAEAPKVDVPQHRPPPTGVGRRP